MERTKEENKKMLNSLYAYRTTLEIISIASVIVGFPALIILGVCWGQELINLLFQTNVGLTATFLIVVIAIVAVTIAATKLDGISESIRKLENELNR